MLEFRRVLLDRKSTRLNSSHTIISYAVFCLKKTKTHTARGARARPHPPLDPAPQAQPARARAQARVGVVGLGLSAASRLGVGVLFFLRSRRPRRSPFFPSTPFAP